VNARKFLVVTPGRVQSVALRLVAERDHKIQAFRPQHLCIELQTLRNVSKLVLQSCIAAGRVQSVALRLVAEREDEIQVFRPQHYWTVGATLQAASGATLQVRRRRASE